MVVSPENAPATINIDLTCALFALEVAEKRVAMTSESRKNRIEDDCEHEIPRLHRILNLPFTPRANRTSTSLTSASTNSSSISTAPSVRSPTAEADKGNKALRSSDAGSTRQDDCEHEIPRLHRILNLPFTPRASRNRSSTSSISTISSIRSPTSDSDKENGTPRWSDRGSTTNVDHNRYIVFPTNDSLSGKPYATKQTKSFVSRAFGIHANVFIAENNWVYNRNSSFRATFLQKERRMPLGDLDSSSLSPEQKVVRRPAPKFKVDIPQFNPFDEDDQLTLTPSPTFPGSIGLFPATS